ncbi:MAG: HAD-IC family P-type ATPase [Natronomonas sp.]
MSDSSPPDDFDDLNEAVVRELVAETTPYERIREVIRNAYAPNSAADVAEAARTSPKTARKHLTSLADEGVVSTETSENGATLFRRSSESLVVEQAAEVLPEDKDETVQELQEQGKLVTMVGDGVNNAPALTRADVGIAIRSGTDVAVQSADVILVKNNPLDVVRLVKLSKASYRKMQENIVWAAGYNVFAIPLAAGILAPIGILLSPAVGALLMSLSTVIVAVNAQLLRRVDLSIPDSLHPARTSTS